MTQHFQKGVAAVDAAWTWDGKEDSGVVLTPGIQCRCRRSYSEAPLNPCRERSTPSWCLCRRISSAPSEPASHPVPVHSYLETRTVHGQRDVVKMFTDQEIQDLKGQSGLSSPNTNSSSGYIDLNSGGSFCCCRDRIPSFGLECLEPQTWQPQPVRFGDVISFCLSSGVFHFCQLALTKQSWVK